MRLLDLFRPAAAAARSRSADTARERLQLVLAVERSGGGPSFLPQLQQDILEVIKRYVEIDNEKVSIELERGQDISMLEVNIELPAGATEKRVGGAAMISPRPA